MDRPEAEALITSHVMSNPELLDDIISLIPHINDWQCKAILEAVDSLQRKNITPSRVTIEHEAGGQVSRENIVHISRYSMPETFFEEAVEYLWEETRRQKLSFYFSQFAGSLSAGQPVKEVMARHAEAMHQVDNLDRNTALMTVGDAVAREIEFFVQRTKGVDVSRVATGYRNLDAWLSGGFQPGLLYYFGARPSVGKTALMLNFAGNAMARGDAIGIETVESSQNELARRIIARRARVNASKVHSGSMVTQDELNRIEDAKNWAMASTALIHHSPRATISEISSVARRMKRIQEIRVLFVDYVQLIGSEITFPSKIELVAHVSQQLKAIALENEIAVVALAQLRRESEGRKKAPPKLSDFSDSSQLEKDADVAVLMDRASQNRVDLIIAKNRDGALATVKMAFKPEYLDFAELTPEEDPDMYD